MKYTIQTCHLKPQGCTRKGNPLNNNNNNIAMHVLNIAQLCLPINM